MLGSLGLAAVGAAVGGPVVASRLADAATHKPPVPPKVPGTLWSPDIRTAGLKIFEDVEDDRAHTDAGTRHIYPVGDAIRFDMNMKVRDTLSGRQRNEAVGMRQNGQILQMLPGQTWRLAWDLFIPATLRATTSFTHIHQLKMPGTGSAPIFVMSLAPLQDRWIHTEFEYGVANNGHVRWTLTDGAQTVIDVTRPNVDLFMASRTRPKWGIYRSLGDRADLRDCYLLTRNFTGSVH